MNKAVLYTTTLMQSKARQVLRDLFYTDQGNGSDIVLWQELLKLI